MIDRIKIFLTKGQFTGNFENAEKVWEGKRSYIHLFRSDKKAVLIVRRTYNTNSVIIQGSIRKWYFGRSSLRDLTRRQYKRALGQIAKVLNTSLKDLAQGKITQCEVGLNVRTQTDCSKVVPQIVKYRTNTTPKYYPENKQNETVCFRLAYYKFIAYDKAVEIAAHAPNKEHKRKLKMVDALKRHGYYFLRIETRLLNQNAFRYYGMEYINTAADIYTHWGNLYEIFANEINRLLMFSKIIISSEMTEREYLLGTALNANGYQSVCQTLLNKVTSKTANGKKTAQSKKRKEIENVIKKYGDNSIATLKHDVLLCLTQRPAEEDINIPYLCKLMKYIPPKSLIV